MAEVLLQHWAREVNFQDLISDPVGCLSWAFSCLNWWCQGKGSSPTDGIFLSSSERSRCHWKQGGRKQKKSKEDVFFCRSYVQALECSWKVQRVIAGNKCGLWGFSGQVCESSAESVCCVWLLGWCQGSFVLIRNLSSYCQLRICMKPLDQRCLSSTNDFLEQTE